MSNHSLPQLYREMANLTAPICGKKCGTNSKNRCCDEMYCEIARDYAKEYYNIDLESTGHPELPFMGANGCTVEPHLRPICTLHVCAINNFGFTKDPEWDEQYFKLRAKIDEKEWEEHGDK